MNLKRFLLVLLLIAVFVQLCNAGKKNKEAKEEKEPKEKKDKESKGKKSKEPKEEKESKKKDKGSKKESKKESKKDKKNKGTAEMGEPEEDTEYWSSENAHRVWTENDNALNNGNLFEITQQMKAFVDIHRDELDSQNENIFALIEEIFMIQGQYIDLGIPVAYLFGDNTMTMNYNLFPISTILGAVVDTKGGQDIPPILTSTCTLEKCTETIYQWLVNEDEVVGHSDLAHSSQPGIIENLQEGFLSTFTQLSQTFSKKDTQEILCARSKSLETTRLTVAAELAIIEQDTKDFLKEPERFSQEYAEMSLKKAFDKVRAKMLLKLIEGLCG